MRWIAGLAATLLLGTFAHAAETAGGEAAGGAEAAQSGTDWEHWSAGNQVDNIASLQRGARNFLNYCVGCHSLKYMRYSRMAHDLRISDEQLKDYLLLAGDKPADYILTRMPAADSEGWFGKTPPDLSLEARSRGTDWIYQFLKTFYADPSKPTTQVNNLRLENAAMPHVLADLQGVQTAAFKVEELKGDGGEVMKQKVFAGFQPGVPGKLTAEQYDDFVRDTVNFLDYVGEPAQADRRQMGIWVVLFLLAFTWIAWLLKKEYWKDVH